MHSANSLSSNSSWNGLKYTETTPTDVIKNALIADGMKQSGFQREVSKVEEVLKQAENDPAIMKGLI